MNRTRNAFLAVMAVVLAPMSANAAPIVQTATCVDSSNQCATGITGLEVMDMILDVSFITGSSYNSVYATDDPFFLGNNSGALATRDAIIAVFADSIPGIVGEGDGTLGSSRLLIPYVLSGVNNVNNGGAFVRTGIGSANWFGTIYSTANTTDFSIFEPGVFTAYAVFELVAVPEPGTLALLGLGLVGMGYSRRRKAS